MQSILEGNAMRGMITRIALATSLLTVGLFSLSESALGQTQAATLRYSPEFILCTVAYRTHTTLKADIPAPQIYFASQITLKQFQDAVEPQWGIRPETFLNVYVWQRNEIYMLDDAEYYKKTGRALDDSVAHELTHYIQVQYKGMDLGSDDIAEMQAVDVQTWFRENFIQKAPPADIPCRL